MTDWMSIEEITKDGVAFGKFMHTLLGLYIWEWFTSLDFDFSYLTGKKQFRWPMIFYFLNRYCLLFALIGIAIALNVTTEIDCQGLYTFNQCFGNAAIGLASINLSLRTMAVWSQKWFIVVPLVMVILGHWSLLLHGILLKAAWVPEQGCVITETDSKLLAVTFIYTMCFDLVVLSLTAWKLILSGPSSTAMGRSKLVNLIFRDGLIFFLIAFVANLIATIFMWINLNPVMSIIANVPAAVASTIVACRAVRRLNKYTSQGPEVFNSTQASTLAFRTTAQSQHAPKRPYPKIVTAASKGLAPFGLGSGHDNNGTGYEANGVHVQMETFESPSDKSYVEYDAMGNVVRSPSDVKEGAYDVDLEEQGIRNEFKRPPY